MPSRKRRPRWAPPSWLVFLSLCVFAASPCFATGSSVVVLLDASGSMRQSDPQCLRRDAVELLISLLETGDRVALAEFGDQVVDLTNGFVPLDQNKKKVLVDAAGRCGADAMHTDILAALRHAESIIAEMGLDARRSHPPSVILLTDGHDDVRAPQPDRLEKIERVIRTIADYGAPIHAIGLSDKADHGLLRKFQNLSGGEVAVVQEDEDLLGGFFDLSRTLGHRWLILEKRLPAGRTTIPIPTWATDLVVAFFPPRPSSAGPLRAGGEQAFLVRPRFQLARISAAGRSEVDLTIPGSGGRVLVDSKGDLVLQAQLPAKAPAGIPFGCSARVLSGRGSDLGRPRFLETMTVALVWQSGGDEGEVFLYDDGLHQDSLAFDGLFGGTAIVPEPGLVKIRIRAKAPYSPAIETSRDVEVIEQPVRFAPPGVAHRYLSALIRRPLPFEIRNRTNVRLQGRLAVTPGTAETDTYQYDLGPGTGMTLPVPIRAEWIRRVAVTSEIVIDGAPEPVAGRPVRVPARLEVPLVLIGFGLLLFLSFRLPRRSVGGSRCSVEIQREGEEYPGTELARIHDDGIPAFETTPEPFNRPGRFEPMHGVWRRGFLYIPESWAKPVFRNPRVTRKKNGFLLKDTETWTCSTSQGKATYRFTPPRR